MTRAQIRRVDEWAVSRYQMHPLVLMENAGRSAAEIIDRICGPGREATIFCGTGNNGGDGCVIARHLHNRRWRVRVLVTGQPEHMSADLHANHRIIAAMNLACETSEDPARWNRFLAESGKDAIVIDALLGTGFSGRVRSPLAELIECINTMPRRTCVAIDVPSGLDCDSGVSGGTAVQADLTITFAAEKPGLRAPTAVGLVGTIYTADIGVPRELLEEVVVGC